MGYNKRAVERQATEWDRRQELRNRGLVCLDCPAELDIAAPLVVFLRRCLPCAEKHAAETIGRSLFTVEMRFLRRTAAADPPWSVQCEPHSTISRRQGPRFTLSNTDALRALIARTFTTFDSQALADLDKALQHGSGRIFLQLDGHQMRKLVR